MPLAGQVIPRWGSRTIAVPALLAFCATLTLLALAPNYATLIAAAALFGALKGAVDVSINAQAITVENAIEKPIISSFQAFWSLGGLGAAFFLSIAMSHGSSPTLLMLSMAMLLFLLTLSSYGRLLADTSSAEREPHGFSWPMPSYPACGLAFLALSAKAFCWTDVEYARVNMSLAVRRWPLPYSRSAWRPEVCR
jgi:MFS family permease